MDTNGDTKDTQRFYNKRNRGSKSFQKSNISIPLNDKFLLMKPS